MSNNMSLYPEPPRSFNSVPHTRLLPESQTDLSVAYWWTPLLQRWYSISAPASVSADASLEKREIARRGRVASLILPVIIALVLLPVPTAIGNPVLLFTLALVFLLDVFALFGLNRTGYVTAAGIVVVIGIELGVATSVLTFPGGLGPSNLPLFDLMVQALVVGVAMLTPPLVFLIAAINSIFIIIVLHSSVPNAELAHIVATNIGSILPPPVTLQIAIAWFTFVLLRSTNQAIRRADRAEELTALTQQNLELQQREIDRTRQIAMGIEQILAAIVRFANGDVMARAPESQDNVLWRIGHSLNILLARQKDYQRNMVELEQARNRVSELQNRLQSNASERELQHMNEAARRLQEAISVARRKRALIELPPPSGTMIDNVVNELHSIQSR